MPGLWETLGHPGMLSTSVISDMLFFSSFHANGFSPVEFLLIVNLFYARPVRLHNPLSTIYANIISYNITNIIWYLTGVSTISTMFQIILKICQVCNQKSEIYHQILIKKSKISAAYNFFFINTLQYCANDSTLNLLNCKQSLSHKMLFWIYKAMRYQQAQMESPDNSVLHIIWLKIWIKTM